MAAPHPGKWRTILNQNSCVLNTEQIATHSCVIHKPGLSNPWKVLYFLAAYREVPNNKVQSRIWDPDPNSPQPITRQDIPDWPMPGEPPRLFCSGHTFLSNGELLVAGGLRVEDPVGQLPHPPSGLLIKGLRYTYIFNPNPPVLGQEWRVAEGPGGLHAMAEGRWYPTLTQLGVTPQGYNGKIIAMSGVKDSDDLGNFIYNKEPEVYNEVNGWSPMPYSGATQPFNEYYPGAHLIPSGPNAGKIFYTIPMLQSYVFNPFWSGLPNGGYWSSVGGQRIAYRLNGISTMLPLIPPYTSAKVLIIGGSSYGSPGLKSAEVIDIASANPQWTQLGNLLSFGRRNHIGVILPNDMLFVVGGNETNYGDGPVFTAELVDTTDPTPANWKSSMLPAHVYPRGHHSTAILLPDATVWVAGQGEVGLSNQLNIEVYEPSYLFEGVRPAILSAPDNISYGVPFGITCSHQITAVRLIKFGVITHSTDMSQLSVGLDFEAGPTNGGFPYTITPPPNANIAPHGLYMLFVLRGQQFSVSGQTMLPSVAKIVMLS